MELRIKKRPSLSKLGRNSNQKQKPMNLTATSAMFSYKQIKEPKLPPLRSALRKTSTKLASTKTGSEKWRNQTETTVVESEMLQSYYQTVDKGWIKPSEYIKDIAESNLIAEEGIDLQNYEIKLNEKMEKNMSKLDMLVGLMVKWVSILTKILQYTVSKKYNTPYLIQQVKFWKTLSKKFDELEYQFNDQKIQHLLVLMKNAIKIKPELKASFEEFVKLKDSVIEKSPLLRKLYLSLEESVSGNIQRFTQSSDIVTSTEFLKRTLLAYEMIAENNQILKERMEVVYDKMNEAMVQKLTVASLSPRELANISSIKQKYNILDKALSFYSNLIGVIEQSKSHRIVQILEKAQYTRNVLVNLLQIMGYFEYLYKNKQVLEFSKLFSVQFEENIFSFDSKAEWMHYMAKVEQSVSAKNYQF